MNAGYYIHRSAIGYLQRGLAWPGEEAQGTADIGGIEGQVQSYIQQKFGQKLNKNLAGRRQKVTEMEKKYQQMLFDPSENPAITEMRQALSQALNEKLSKKFEDAAGSVDIENLAVAAFNGANGKVYEAELKSVLNGTLKQITNKEKITEGRLKTIAQEIQRRIDAIAKNHQSLEALQADFEKTSTDFNKFRMEIEELASGLSTGASNFIKFPMGETITLESLKAMIQLIGDSKSLLAANQSGDIGEWLAPMMKYALMEDLKVAMDEMKAKAAGDLVEYLKGEMMSFNLGGTTVDMVINPEGQIIRDSSARTKDQAGLVLTVDEQSAGCKIIHRTNKTDAFFYINDSEGQREDISVKNYSSLSGITLVSNTPLNFILSQVGGGSLGHLHNILSYHHEGDGLIVGYRNAVNTQVMKMILCFALVGYSDQNRPSIFMVISNKKVYCFDMDSLIAELISSTVDGSGNYATYYDGGVGGGIGAAITFNAGWNLDSSVNQPVFAPTPEERVNAAIRNFEAQKIHASLSIHLTT